MEVRAASSPRLTARRGAALENCGWGAAVVVWVTVVAIGAFGLGRYASTPGAASTPPERWPEASAIARTPGLATMVLVAHPMCPCTRATIGELAQVMERVRDRAIARVLFVRPEGVDEGWEKTDLWRSASAIPGVTASTDAGGVEAARFHASTSGDTIVYDAEGRLLFSGGITGGRGHAGDNPGESRVVSLLTKGTADRSQGPVFGCSLEEPTRAAP
jgi:hypothetical protein